MEIQRRVFAASYESKNVQYKCFVSRSRNEDRKRNVKKAHVRINKSVNNRTVKLVRSNAEAAIVKLYHQRANSSNRHDESIAVLAGACYHRVIKE